MSLPPGTRFGVFEVVAPIGAGGMGEVFRATDTELGRTVALKILPQSFAADADRLMRFEREAKTLASLNHPHIAQIYGLADRDGVRALVMEFVEGEDLAQRLARGRLTLDEAVPLARQIAEALEAAHERGIVHRDLKPANIKIRDDGAVKVLDFGLAKAADANHRGGDAGIANSPTITSPAMTQAGVVLGTATYMSPEQAKGKAVDQRADIWAFGCVLYEMLTGRRAFDGADVPETLAAIIRGEPDWNALPAECPPALHRLLRRCLQKDPGRRLRHIGDARLDLEDADLPTLAMPVVNNSRSVWAAWLTAAAAGAVALAAIGWPPVEQTRPQVYMTFRLPEDLQFRIAPAATAVVVSPDGRLVLFRSSGDGAFYLRAIDSPGFVKTGTRGTSPFFSPDSKWFAYFDDATLKKQSVSGGPAVVLCKTEAVRGAWADDGTIVLVTREGMSRVADSGGQPQLLFAPTTGMTENVAPVALPGSKALLFRTVEGDESWIQSLSLADKRITKVVQGSNPKLAGGDLLLFDRDNAVWAVPFDAGAARVTGSPITVSLSIQPSGPAFVYSTSRNGDIVFLQPREIEATLTWIDRSGKMEPAIATRGAYSEPQLSPGGDEVVVTAPPMSGGQFDLYVINLARETTRRLTTTGARRPRWSVNNTVAYQDPRQNIRIVRADGTGEIAHLNLPNAQFPDAWAPDGQTLVFNEGALTRDLWAYRAGKEPFRLMPPSGFSERGGRVSPSGKLLAFVSDESGRDEVYVQPFPGPGAKTVVSRSGGRQPVWSRKGNELFYRSDDYLMTVSITDTPLRIGRTAALIEFRRALFGDDPHRAEYDVAPDGRFIAARAADELEQPEIVMILNWAASFTRASRGQ